MWRSRSDNENARFLGLVAPIAIVAVVSVPMGVYAQTTDVLSIPLQHVSSDDDGDYDALGIMIGVEDSTPRLFQFDTGSDDFLGQFDSELAAHGRPTMIAYGDGTYGYWMQKIQFENLSYYDPASSSEEPVAGTTGEFGAGQILDWVYTKSHHGLENHSVTAKPVATYEGEHLYADLDVRERIHNGEPSDHPPFYGTYGAGDFKMSKGPSTTLGSQTDTGYVISANANMGNADTPGCAPCLMLHLNPSLRSQFTAVVPWGKLHWGSYEKQFDQSLANASNQHEGSYQYTISFDTGTKTHAVDFEGPLLFDTGTPEFIYVEQDYVLKALNSKGLKLDDYDDEIVDFTIRGFADHLNNVAFSDVVISRLSDEDEGKGLTIGLPFFQQNALLYDLENKRTAFSPYFVTAQDFTTDTGTNDLEHLGTITDDIGSLGWLGLAGSVSGTGDLVLEEGTNVRMTGINDYTGATRVATDTYLHLAGPGSLEQSSNLIVDGTFSIEQKGSYIADWDVPDTAGDTRLRSLEGGEAGDILLGGNTLVLTAAEGRFDGSITDYDEDGNNLGGSLVIEAGRLVLGGNSDFSGGTVVGPGAELHVEGSLTGDVTVSGTLVVEGQVSGTVTIEVGGQVIGDGTVGNVRTVDEAPV